MTDKEVTKGGFFGSRYVVHNTMFGTEIREPGLFGKTVAKATPGSFGRITESSIPDAQQVLDAANGREGFTNPYRLSYRDTSSSISSMTYPGSYDVYSRTHFDKLPRSIQSTSFCSRPPGEYWTFWLAAKTLLTLLLGLATISLPFLTMYVLLGYRTQGTVEGWGNLVSFANFFLLLGGIVGFLACLSCVFASIVRRRADSSIDSETLKLLVPLLAIQLLALFLAFPLANR